MRRLVTGCLALTPLLLAGPALAEGECGWSPAGWNAPNGAVVFSRSEGPVKAVLDAVGEFRTHSTLSHGPGAGVSHATMASPEQTSWPTVCSTPLHAGQLQYGYPGLEQINQGGIYMNLYGLDGGPEWIGWQRGDATQAAIVADTLWYNHPFVSDRSRTDSNQFIDRPLRHGERVHYSLFQYRDLESAHRMPSHSVNNGMVCSTFLAYAHAYAGRGEVPPHTYSHDQVAGASTSLFWSVHGACKNSLGWFEGTALTLFCPFSNVCANAGSQATNCMSANRCDTSDERIWKGVRDDPHTTATSISPDRLGGWGVHPLTTTLWAPDYTHALQWNSGGNVYGCWY